MTDAQAADAIRAHHREMATELRRRVAAVGTAVREGRLADDARQAVLAYLDAELLPHAGAEEKALYPAGDRGNLAMLVRAMRDEHVNLVNHVDALRRAAEADEVIGLSAAILALFESHLHKENELLIPALVADPEVELGPLLEGMHELLG
ncbi:MAG TPA: hemerythrin domain-containing protein [candidate division Zixibacteria bacterium]|nr:hemerythrin domain-containing protein [candidate division Zixibacteria bacterium]